MYGEKVEDSSVSIWDTTIQDGLEDEVEWDYTIYPDPRNIEVKDSEEVKSKDEFFEQLDKIEKSKKNILDLNQDGIIDEEEIKKAELMIQKLENQIKPGLSSFRINKIKNEINKIKEALPNDDETKTY